MIIPSFRFLSKRVNSLALLVIIAGLLFGRNASVHAMDSARGGPLPQSPLFPPDNWWNLDISSWPVILIPVAISHLSTTVGLDGSIQILAATQARLRTQTRSTVFPMRLFQTSLMLTFERCNLSMPVTATV